MNNALIFGGFYYDNGSYSFLNDLYSFDFKLKKIQQINTINAPIKRGQHNSFMTKNDELIVIGGWNIDYLMNDIQMLNLNSKMWKTIKTINPPRAIKLNKTKGIYPAQFSTYTYGTDIIVYGICNDNTLYILDMKTSKWTNYGNKLNLKYSTISKVSKYGKTCIIGINNSAKFEFHELNKN